MCGAGGNGRYRFCGRWKCERERVIVGVCQGCRAAELEYSVSIYRGIGPTSVLWFRDRGSAMPRLLCRNPGIARTGVLYRVIDPAQAE